MRNLHRFSLFAVALLFAAVAFVNGSPTRGKVPALSELTIDVYHLADSTMPPAIDVDARVSPSNIAAPAVQAVTLGDQLIVANYAGAEHYAREPERMTLPAVRGNSTHITQPPALALFAIPEPGGRSSDVLAQLTCNRNSDFRRV